MTVFLNISGGLTSDEDVPGLIDSPAESEDEDNMKNISGQTVVYPWHKELCSQSNFTEQAKRWLKLSDDGRNNAFKAIERLLISPFLFQKRLIPEKWIRWAEMKDLILYDHKTESILPSGRLRRKHYLVTRMFVFCLKKIRSIVEEKKNVVNIMEMMYSIKNLPSTENGVNRAVSSTKDNVIVKRVLAYFKSELNKLYEREGRFFNEFDRFSLTVLLCFRQFAEVVHIIACEGRNIAVEVEDFYSDKFYYLTNDSDQGREQGNDMYKKGSYDSAIDIYTAAINRSPYHYLLYSNRCQAAIKTRDYDSAFVDAYRTVILKPEWTKGYYKLVRCLDELTYYDEAKHFGDLGLHKCRDPQMAKSLGYLVQTIDLKILKARAARISPEQLKINSSLPNKEIDPVEPQNGKKKRKRKKKAKKTDDEDVPELVSDEEFEENPKTDKSKKESEEKKKKSAEQKRLKKEEAQKKKEAEEEEQRKREEQEKKEAEERHRIEEEKRKKEKKETKERDAQKEYEQYLTKGSAFFFKDCFNDACKSYTLAIELIGQHKKIRGFTDNDVATLLYCRGISSQRQGTPTEIHISQKYFHRIISEFGSFSHVCMVYFANAKSIYLLNNLQESIEEASKALQFAKKFPICGFLTWPGTTENIPESNEKILKQEIKILKQQCGIRPIPAAVCRYGDCSKDYHRKEIYFSDLNFEGFFIVSCEWNCILKFHHRCWSKYKHHKFNLSGDKDVLGAPCTTPDCEGHIIFIKMLGEDLAYKKNLQISSEKRRKETKLKMSKFDQRTSKNELNLKKYKEILFERKAKKKKYSSQENTDLTYDKLKCDEFPINNIPADQDLSEATVYVKSTGGDSSQKIHGQRSGVKISRRISPISFNQYCTSLPGYHRGMPLDLVTDAIKKAKLILSFSLPDDLREEIERFELSLVDDEEDDGIFSDDEKMKMPFLFEYFQDFFSVQGPLDTNNELFKSQIVLLPPDMQDIVRKFGGLISFLNASPLFIQIPPYIGIHTQHTILKKLTDDMSPVEYKHEYSSRTSSIDHEVFTEYEDIGLSQFAKEFYQIGAHVQDMDIVNLTGGTEQSGGDVLKPDHFLPEMSKSKNILNSETSSMLSLDDLQDTKSETGSQASVEGSKRPITPLKQTAIQNSVKKQKKKPPSAVEIGTQTIGRDEGQKAKEAVGRLQERLEEIESSYTKLKRTSQTREESLLKQLEEAKESEKVAVQKKESMKQIAETEMIKITQLKKQAQDKANIAESKITECRAREKEAQMNLTSLTAGMQTDRERHLKEIVDLRKGLELKELEANANRLRAIKAEVDVTRAKEAFHIGVQMQAKGQCEQAVREFDLELTRLNVTMPDHILQHFRLARKQWAGNVITCAKTIETLKAAYASIIDQISAGHSLSDLQSVPDLKPPEPGPSPRHMMLTLQRSSLNSHGSGIYTNGAAGGDGISPGISGTAGVNDNKVTSKLLQQSNARGSPSNMRDILAAAGIHTPPPAGADLTRPVKKNNFQLLIDKLTKNIPQLSREQVERCTQQVRAQNKGLTGLLYEEIEQRIKLMSGMEIQVQASSSSSQSRYVTKENDELLNYEDEEDSTCPICCDPLKDGKITTLDCQHKFHSDCINKWMQKQRTCPNCRKFMADTSEFPALPSQNGVIAPPGL